MSTEYISKATKTAITSTSRLPVVLVRCLDAQAHHATWRPANGHIVCDICRGASAESSA